MMGSPSDKSNPAILIVDGDILSRHVIADYLRHCGYDAVEAANADEAYAALSEPTLSIDVILCAITTLSPQTGFELSQWVRTNRPELKVKLVGGVQPEAEAAADLCEAGPHSAPYEPEAVVSYIKRLRASRVT